MTDSNSFQEIEQKIIVPLDYTGMRLDQIIVALWPNYSRTQHQKWLKQGDILVDGNLKKAKEKLFGGEEISLKATLETQNEWQPEDLPIDIVYEDDDIIVINKAADCVVHPGAGNLNGTLSNALLAHKPEFSLVPRAGIVHRLDKNTTGLMVAAKSLSAHTSLVAQLSDHSVKREYEAIVNGVMRAGGTVDLAIGRSPHNRLKMAVNKFGRKAVTHVEVMEIFDNYTRVKCRLETGRTHQIRVHLQHLNFPIVGDNLYGKRNAIPKHISPNLREKLIDFKRQALHARALSFTHPITGKIVNFKAKPPKDHTDLLAAIKDNYEEQSSFD